MVIGQFCFKVKYRGYTIEAAAVFEIYILQIFMMTKYYIQLWALHNFAYIPNELYAYYIYIYLYKMCLLAWNQMAVRMRIGSFIKTVSVKRNELYGITYRGNIYDN